MDSTEARRVRNQRHLWRWLLSLGFLAFGMILLFSSPDLVLAGTPIAAGWLFVVVGGLGVLGCLFGLNIFAGGPLDMRNDPPVPKENAD